MDVSESGLRNVAKRIYDEVHGYIELSEVELDIVNTSIFQRLRYIRQLATAWYVYPGATHTRFSHSIGAMHIAGMVSSKFYRLGYIHDPDDVQLLRLAALLHDIGHTPFSHAIEPFFRYRLGINHEEISRVTIEESPEIKDILSKHGFDYREVIAVLEGRYKEPLYNQLLSSDVDIDRMDYLIRDALHTGVAYGTIDLHRLIATMAVDGEGNVAILDKGVDAVDNFYLARMHMYKAVYYHKTLVGYELILRRIYEQLSELYSDEPLLFKTMRDIVKAIRSGDIVYWNDDWLIGFMMDVYRSRSAPKQLKELIEAFFKRRGYKVIIDVSNFSNDPLDVESDDDVKQIQSIEVSIKDIVEPHQIVSFVDDIKILDEDPHVVPRIVFTGKRSIPITECTTSIVKYVPRRYHVKRLYVITSKWGRVVEELRLKGLLS
uniref:HD domain-containing protein n=1 Tax=Ignisphaera aggregans TaxID=334771 RepID=A0A7C2ZQ42_9CREN